MSNYCRDLVRRQDYNSYLTSIFQPHKRIFYAIRAFQLESPIASTAAAQLKSQWWKDEVDALYVRPCRHPILKEIEECEDVRLTKAFLKRIMRAKGDVQTIEDMEMNAELIYSSVLYLQFEVMGEKDLDSDGSHLGRAMGLVQMMRNNKLPTNFEGERKDFIFEIATRANDHLLSMKHDSKILLPKVWVGDWLKRLERADFDLNNPWLDKNIMLPFKLLKEARKK